MFGKRPEVTHALSKGQRTKKKKQQKNHLNVFRVRQTGLYGLLAGNDFFYT